MYALPIFKDGGEGCLLIELSDSVDLEANMSINALRDLIDKRALKGVRETVPTYRSLAVYFDPLKISKELIIDTARSMLDGMTIERSEEERIVVIPVAYGDEFGPDMRSVCEHTGLDESEVIRRHTARDCYCYMLGFMPGFAYLGGMDDALETPRLSTPRVLIPAGSVGIAGKQTGAYSFDSPGGWQLIGRTPLKLFDPKRQRASLIEAGDRVRFQSISREEFDRLASLSSREGGVSSCR